MRVSFLKILFPLLLVFFIGPNSTFGLYDDYKSHKCIRPCNNETAPMLCEYDWSIEWYSVLSYACLDCPFNRTHCDAKNCVASNGFPRAILTVNRMLPGPSLTVCQGDTISVMLHNKLHFGEATTIHWHGLKQKKTPYMDGVNMVTQCPVVAHTNFEYFFEADSHGTHFWHAHAGLQRSDGFFGPIVVHQYEEENPHKSLYDYDLQEHVITVNDWLNNTSIEKFAGHHHNDGDNKPRSILINGKGVLVDIHDDQNVAFQTPRAVFSVEQGMRYRFRIINAGILYCPIEISVDKHNMTVISSDGNDVEPYEIESLIIMAGERYDFIVNANQAIDNYWIRAKGFADCGNYKVFQTAILNYKLNGESSDRIPSGAPLQYDTMSRKGLQLNPWNRFINSSNRNEYTTVDELRTVIDKEFEEDYKKILNATNVKKHYLSMEFNKINNPDFNDEKTYPLSLMDDYGRAPLYTPQINNISLRTPNYPVLYEWDIVPRDDICNEVNASTSCTPEDPYCSCIYTYEFELNEVVEFVIADEGFTFQSNHPMHFHGHKYAVMGIDKLNRSVSMETIKEMDAQGLLKRNFDNPPLKDTVTVPVGGYTIIRFLTNNPGTWLFHCHLEFHSEIGMAFMVRVGQKKDLPGEPKNWPKCGNYRFTGNSARKTNTIEGTVILIVGLSYALFNCF